MHNFKEFKGVITHFSSLLNYRTREVRELQSDAMTCVKVARYANIVRMGQSAISGQGIGTLYGELIKKECTVETISVLVGCPNFLSNQLFQNSGTFHGMVQVIAKSFGFASANSGAFINQKSHFSSGIGN